MKSDDTEAIAAIDRQINEFEELLKELISSLYRLGFAEALLASIKPAPRPPGERRPPPPAVLSQRPPMSKEEEQRVEKERQTQEKFNASYQAARSDQEVLERRYDTIYDDTEHILRKYFPSEDDLKKLRDNVVSNLRTQMEAVEKEQDEQFRRNPRLALMFYSPPPAIECKHYIQASKQCIFILRSCRRKIEKFGAEQERTFVHQGDIVMRDKNQSIGDITNSSISGLVQGEQNTVIATLSAAWPDGIGTSTQNPDRCYSSKSRLV